MILGTGCDIAKISRFSRWIENPSMIRRFFNPAEIYPESNEQNSVSEHRLCEYYAVRFAAKEAFSKAMGTGLSGIALRDIYITKSEKGKPSLCVEGTAEEKLKSLYGNNVQIHVTLSHEKEYALAFVIIERG